LWFIDQSVYIGCVSLTKISLLFFYLRIFKERVFRAKVYVFLALCIGFLVGFVIASVFQCEPLSHAWQFWAGERPGPCGNVDALVWSAGAANIVLDISVTILPVAQLWRSKMTTARKVSVMTMFLLALM